MAPDLILNFINWVQAQIPAIGALLLLMLIDVLTGVCAGIIERKISSATSYKGMLRKAVMLLVVAAGAVLRPYSGAVPVDQAIAMCFIATELFSIIENMGRAGVPIPKALSDVMKVLGGNKDAPPLPSPIVERASNVEIHMDGEKGASGSVIIRQSADTPKA